MIDLLYRLCWGVLIVAAACVVLVAVAGLAVQSQSVRPAASPGGAR